MKMPRVRIIVTFTISGATKSFKTSKYFFSLIPVVEPKNN